MLFLHCSDIHLGRKPTGSSSDLTRKRFNDYFDSFAKIIQKAIDFKVDAFIVAGDLFDKKELSPDVLARTEVLFEILKNAEIPAIVIEGNHDNIIFGMEQDSWLIYLENKDLIKRPTYRFDDSGYHFTPLEIKGIDFYGLGYPGSFVNEILISLSEHFAEKASQNNVVIVHTAIAGNNIFPGTADQSTIDILKDKCLYIAGGHYHYYHYHPRNEPVFFIPGSGEYWDSSEFEQTKGFILYDTESKKHSFHTSELRNVLNIIINVNDELTSVSELVESELSNKTITNEDILNVKIIFSGPFIFDRDELETTLDKYNPMKYFIKIEYPQTQSNKDYTDLTLSTESIEEDIISNWEYFSSDTTKTLATFEKLKQIQESGPPESFFELFDTLLNELTEGVNNAN